MIQAVIRRKLTGELLYLGVADTAVCETRSSLFPALPETDDLAKLNSKLPDGEWTSICNGTQTTSWEIDTADGTDGYTEPNTGGGTITDPGAETDVINYTSASGDDGGTK